MARIALKLVVVVLAFGAVAQAWVLTRLSSNVEQRCDTRLDKVEHNVASDIPQIGSVPVGDCCDSWKNGTGDPVQMCFHEGSKRFTLINKKEPSTHRRRYYKISSQRSSDPGATFVAYFSSWERDPSVSKSTWPFHRGGNKVPEDIWEEEISGQKTGGNQYTFWHANGGMATGFASCKINDSTASCKINNAFQIEVEARSFHEFNGCKIKATVMTLTNEKLPLPGSNNMITNYQITTLDETTLSTYFQGFEEPDEVSYVEEYITIDASPEVSCPLPTMETTTSTAPNHAHDQDHDHDQGTTTTTAHDQDKTTAHDQDHAHDQGTTTTTAHDQDTTTAHDQDTTTTSTAPHHAHDQDTTTTTTMTPRLGPDLVVCVGLKCHVKTGIIVILVLLVLILVGFMIFMCYSRSKKDQDPRPVIELPCPGPSPVPLVVPVPVPVPLIDATDEFHGRVTVAMDHFTANPGDVRVVKLFSDRLQQWHRNTFEERAKFRPVPEGPEDDVTEEFFGHVTNAVDHFKANRGDVRTVKMISVSEGKWYRNTINATSDFTPIPEASLPDATGEFHGHVTKAHDHFKLTGFQNDGRHVKVYSERDGRYYQNSLAAPGEFHPVPER